jgi:hypothetical protein
MVCFGSGLEYMRNMTSSSSHNKAHAFGRPKALFDSHFCFFAAGFFEVEECQLQKGKTAWLIRYTV